jgi:hypothetical protein
MPARSTVERPGYRRRTRADLFDKRTAQWRRRCELVSLYEASLGGTVSPALQLQIERAAEMGVIAERARASFLTGQAVSLDDVVRTERAAASAVRALRIGDRKPKAETLHDYLAAKAT